MKLKPNKLIHLTDDELTLLSNSFLIGGSFIINNEPIPAQMIEIPPHNRTLKVKSKHVYCKIPYTQFYFTNIRGDSFFHTNPLVFVCNSFDKNGFPIRSIFSNCSNPIKGVVCWGGTLAYNNTPKEIISIFWNSKFDYEPYPLVNEHVDFSVTDL